MQAAPHPPTCCRPSTKPRAGHARGGCPAPTLASPRPWQGLLGCSRCSASKGHCPRPAWAREAMGQSGCDENRSVQGPRAVQGTGHPPASVWRPPTPPSQCITNCSVSSQRRRGRGSPAPGSQQVPPRGHLPTRPAPPSVLCPLPGRGPVAAETLQVGDPAMDTALREWHRIRTHKASTPGCRARSAGARVRMQTCPRPLFRDHGWLPRRSCVGPEPGVKEGWAAGARGRLAHLPTSLEERLNIRINPPICSE